MPVQSGSMRKLLLGIGLVATVAAVWWVGETEQPEMTKVSAKPRDAGGRPGAPRSEPTNEQLAALSLEKLARGDFAAAGADAFPSRTWAPPPPPPPPAKPIPPSAPPLPFAYLGKLAEGDSTVVFLTRDQRNLSVRQGDTIDGAYRVEAITPESVVFIYLPLDQRQTLNFGRAH